MIANTKPLKVNGKYVLKITDVGESDYTERYTCSLLGWSRNPIVGQGATPEAAIGDWLRLNGISQADYNSRYRDPIG